MVCIKVFFYVYLLFVIDLINFVRFVYCSWDIQGDFIIIYLFFVVKVKLYMESLGMFSLEDKEFGKVRVIDF